MKHGLEMHAVEIAEDGQRLALAIAFYEDDGFACDPDAMRANLRVLRSSPQAHLAVVTDGPRVLAFAITTTFLELENGLIAELEDLYVAPRTTAPWARHSASSRRPTRQRQTITSQ